MSTRLGVALLVLCLLLALVDFVNAKVPNWWMCGLQSSCEESCVNLTLTPGKCWLLIGSGDQQEHGFTAQCLSSTQVLLTEYFGTDGKCDGPTLNATYDVNQCYFYALCQFGAPDQAQFWTCD